MPQKEGVPENEVNGLNNLRVIKYVMFFTAILLYTVSGLYHHQTFPWFVGDAFGKIKLNMDWHDAFEILLIFGWLVVFTGHAYLIYLDSKCNKWYAVAYIVGYYQFIICVSGKAYFHSIALNHVFFNYVDYGSALFCIVMNAVIFSLNKYVLPQSHSQCINTFMVHLLIFVFLVLFLYETIFGSIFGEKMCSKLFQLFLFFGHYFLILIFVRSQESEEETDDDDDEVAGEHEPMKCKMNQQIMNQQRAPHQRHHFEPGGDEFFMPYYDPEHESFII